MFLISHPSSNKYLRKNLRVYVIKHLAVTC
jgi:hypothetical protein